MKHTLLIAGLALASLTGTLRAQNLLAAVEAAESRKANDLVALEAAQADLTAATEAAADLTPPGKVDPKLQHIVNQLTLSIQRNAPENWTARLGQGWRDKFRSATYAIPNDTLVDIYIDGNEFSAASSMEMKNLWVSFAKKQEWLAHIGAKPTLSAHDFSTVNHLRIYHPAVASRGADFAAFLPSGAGIRGEDYYAFHTLALQARKVQGTTWQVALTADEWLDLVTANAHFSATTFTVGRDKVALRAARLLIKKRQADGLSVEGPEFEAAFAPILAALKAPKLGGLREACAALGIDMGIPADIDWSAQEAVASAVAAAAERNGTFITAWNTEVSYVNGLGSVMFVKGEAGYNAWREATLDKD
jgi:hypothetical protein